MQYIKKFLYYHSWFNKPSLRSGEQSKKTLRWLQMKLYLFKMLFQNCTQFTGIGVSTFLNEHFQRVQFHFEAISLNL